MTPAPGSALPALVAIMDRLRSPGGCPWDAGQTHRSLAPYLLEESYETLDAIERDCPLDLREELGDLLFQVLFHARLAQELPAGQRFDIDDVAADAAAKLTRRHPHVFADVQVESTSAVEANWDRIKQAEKRRESVTDGIPRSLPALALAGKLLDRARRGAVAAPLPDDDSLGSRLFALVAEAAGSGVDAELALRESAHRYAESIQQVERAQR